MKLILIAALSIFIISCNGSKDEGKNSNSIEGLDLSGTWRFTGVECYDSDLQSLTAVGTISSGSPVGTTTIDGNQLTSESSNGSCKVTYKRSVVATLKSGDSENGYGTGTWGSTTISVNPGTSCTGVTSFTMSTGSINPSTISSTLTQGETLSKQTFEFIINPPYLAITSIIQVVGRPTDICFLIQEKI